MFIPTLCSLNNSKEIPFNSIKYFSTSLKYIEKKKGYNFSPCLTPGKTPRLVIVILYTRFYITMHIVYYIKNFPFYFTTQYFFPQANSPHCIECLAEIYKGTKYFFPK